MKFLGYINKELSKITDYQFGEFKDEVNGNYWVGEYTETNYSIEQGNTEYTFMLIGTTNKNWIDLINDKDKIKKVFEDYRKSEKNYAVCINYQNSYNLPSTDRNIKRMQINLIIKEWRN